MFNEVLKLFPGARKDTRYNQWYVDCSLVNSKGFVSFKFGNVVIKAPFRDFIWQQPDYKVCVLGFVPDAGESPQRESHLDADRRTVSDVNIGGNGSMTDVLVRFNRKPVHSR